MPTTKEYTPTDDRPSTDSPASTLSSFDDKASLASTIKPSQPRTASSPPRTKRAKPAPKWYSKFSSQPEKPGEETWRDASLPDKERWKQWQKAKDRERARGSATGFYTNFYKQKGGWAW